MAVVATFTPPLGAIYRRTGAWAGETIWGSFARIATAVPDKPMIVDGRRRLTFAAALAASERLAGGLAMLGVAAGDVVAFQLPNWWETVVVLLASMRLGAVASPVLPIHRERELRFLLHQSRARVCFVPGFYRDTDHRALIAAVRADLPALEHVVVVRDEAADGAVAHADLAAAPPMRTPPPADAGAIALLLYTSGTTADPKGVIHSHDTLLAEARSLGPAHALGPDDTVLMPSPLTHISGLVHALLVPAALGTTAVLMERWEAAAALRLIASERVTYMVGAPTFLRDLAEHPALPPGGLPSFRLFSCGGADVDPALIREAASRLGCVAKRVYGSSEFPTVTTTGPDDPAERRIDSDGRPIGGTEVRLVDDDGEVAIGQEGEILARGPECCLGYHDPTLNADTFTGDGWFRTGDLGTLDASGFLRITGRRKDIIIRKGENISARELEELLAAHPAVAEVAVIGLPHPAAGEIACAVLRVRSGARAPSLGELAAYLLGQGLSKRKLPERVEVVDNFPRTASGKVLKRALRGQLVGR